MNYRMYKFYARAKHSADVTIVHDIKMRDPISSIVLGFEFHRTLAATSLHCVSCIKKIELVDGSDVLFSLDGYEAEALDWYNNGGKFRSNYNYCLAPGALSRFIGINFGRWLWDPEYAFDPKQFTNPQLRITLDYDAWAVSGDYIHVTGWANMFDEKVPSLRGFLMSKEIKEWSIASTVHDYTDLPLDHPYRALYFRAYKASKEPGALVSNFKLSEDQDKKIPYDDQPDGILRGICEKYPPVEEEYWFPLDTAQRFLHIAPTTRVTAYGDVWAAAAAVQDPAYYDGDGGWLKTIAKANPSNTQIHVRGYLPHSVYEIPCGMKDDPADWWDVTRLGSLRADITGGAGAKGFLFTHQERLY